MSPTSSSFHNLKAIIRLVFEQRETSLVLPILFKEDEMPRMQNFWNEYLRSLRPEHLTPLWRDIDILPCLKELGSTIFVFLKADDLIETDILEDPDYHITSDKLD